MRLKEGRRGQSPANTGRGQSPGLSGRGQSGQSPGRSGRGLSPAREKRGQSPLSLSANLSREAEKAAYRPPVHQVPAKKDIVVKESNPFSDPGNPFGSPATSEDLGENNPFAESNPFGNTQGGGQGEKESNPFGDDDYDEELNPFA